MKRPKPLTAITLLQEIQEQPQLLRNRLAPLLENMNASQTQYPTLDKRFLRIIAIGEGSSRNALALAAPFLEAWLGLPVYIHNPESLEEHLIVAQQYRNDAKASIQLYENAYFLVVSQSGKTASVLRILELLEKTLKSPLEGLALTNAPTSPIATRLPHHLWIEAGEEKAIAATKTLTASVGTLLTWGLCAGVGQKKLSQAKAKAIAHELYQTADGLNALFQKDVLKAIEAFARRLVEVNHFILLSKGPLVTVLTEAGLKLTETSRNIVYTDNTESFKHGPKVMLSGIGDNHPNAVYLIPPDKGLAQRLFGDIGHHFWANPGTKEAVQMYETDRVFAITFENSPPMPRALIKGLKLGTKHALTLPKANPVESIFMALVAFQLISYYLALSKGENPDNPSLEKAVIH